MDGVFFIKDFRHYEQLKKLLHPNLYVIFGGGHFGLKSLSSLLQKGICILIDQTAISKIQAEQLSLIQIRTEDLDNLNISSNKPIGYFLQGSIPELRMVIEKICPQYLIPTAPIHVAAEYLKEFLVSLKLNLMIHQKSPKELLNLLAPIPKNLNILPSSDQKSYLSYAKFNEKCPDSCISPLDWCPYFQREKLIPLYSFLKQKFQSNQHIFHFRSEQLGAGFGGIRMELFFGEIIRLGTILENFLSNSNQNEIDLTFVTSCNCHGVLERINIAKSNEK